MQRSPPDWFVIINKMDSKIAQRYSLQEPEYTRRINVKAKCMDGILVMFGKYRAIVLVLGVSQGPFNFGLKSFDGSELISPLNR